MGLRGGSDVNVYGGGSSDGLETCMEEGRNRIKKVQLYNGRTGA